MTDDDNATVTIELVDTNIERIINANAMRGGRRLCNRQAVRTTFSFSS